LQPAAAAAATKESSTIITCRVVLHNKNGTFVYLFRPHLLKKTISL
jgi:hypothetical protein